VVHGASGRLSADDVALRLNIAPDRVVQLAQRGAIEPGADGRFDPGDVHRVRLLLAFQDAGVPIDALLAASRAGTISLRYYDQLHPPPGAMSTRSYADFKASIPAGDPYLPQLFAAFGLAEPEPDGRLTVEDEQLVGDMLTTVVATGQPDLALRAMRMFGEGARRAADGALGVYGEAARRAEGDVRGLPVDDVFERLLRPWARLTQQSASLAAWLARHHLTRAIDEYSVTETESVLETAGLLPRAVDTPPAVAFIDLTGFTRLTEERGDEVAAAIAMRLGELASDAVRAGGGRVVKLLGDGVLVRFDHASAAAGTALDLLSLLPAADLPTGHAGVASGPLIARDGDVFGRTVNLAARVSDVAPDGHLYAPEAVASMLDPDRFSFKLAGSAVLPGIGRTDLVDIVLRAG
jgi:adenylate cyclase